MHNDQHIFLSLQTKAPRPEDPVAGKVTLSQHREDRGYWVRVRLYSGRAMRSGWQQRRVAERQLFTREAPHRSDHFTFGKLGDIMEQLRPGVHLIVEATLMYHGRPLSRQRKPLPYHRQTQPDPARSSPFLWWDALIVLGSLFFLFMGYYTGGRTRIQTGHIGAAAFLLSALGLVLYRTYRFRGVTVELRHNASDGYNALITVGTNEAALDATLYVKAVEAYTYYPFDGSTVRHRADTYRRSVEVLDNLQFTERKDTFRVPLPTPHRSTLTARKTGALTLVTWRLTLDIGPYALISPRKHWTFTTVEHG